MVEAQSIHEAKGLSYNHKIDLQGWRLECLRQRPSAVNSKPATPILFLHGIFVGAWCWQHFLTDFAKHGYDAWALSFRGHGGSSHGCDFDLGDFVADAQAAVDEIKRVTGQKPIVVGHSMGGLVLQRLMLTRALKGAVLLCSIPPQGLLPLAASNWLLRPMDAAALSKLALERAQITPEQLKVGMFAQPIEDTLLKRYAAKTVSESWKLWLDLAEGAMLAPWFKSCSVAVIGSDQDTLVPQSMTYLTAMTYQKPVKWLHGLGHGVMLEQDWQQAADCVREAMASF